MSITFAGFRSRCTMPVPCARSSASAICDADAAAPRQSAAGPASSRVGERLAFEVLHDQECRCPSCFADVVQRADVRMIERGDRARLALEALAQLRVRRRLAGRTLIATVRSRRVSRAR